MFKTILKTVLPILFAAACAFAGIALVGIAKETPPKPAARQTPLVRALVASPGSTTFDVRTFGVVHPSTETTLVARVQGTVEYVSPSFREGGSFTKGEVLVRIDRRDFELRKIESEALVAEARAVHDRIRAESEVARKEWESFGKGTPEPLVVREPQLAEAKAKLDAAQARLDAADLDLERTEIKAPYDGRVRRKAVDIGQFVSAGVPIGEVIGTESAEVRLPITDDQFAFLDLPLGGELEAGGPVVTISARFAGEEHSWSGRIVRTESEVDPRTRVLYAVARIEDPYGQVPTARSPLLPGMFVEASIRGRTVEQVTELPEQAIRPDDRVLAIDGDSKLRWRSVTLLRSTSAGMVAVTGLAAGDRVCLTDVRPVVEGMAVRVATEGETPR